MAYQNNLTCFNIVNAENSPITTIIDQLQNETEEKKGNESDQPQMLFNASDSDDEFGEKKEAWVDRNIGLYQKSGHCYSDVKSFIP